MGKGYGTCHSHRFLVGYFGIQTTDFPNLQERTSLLKQIRIDTKRLVSYRVYAIPSWINCGWNKSTSYFRNMYELPLPASTEAILLGE